MIAPATQPRLERDLDGLLAAAAGLGAVLALLLLWLDARGGVVSMPEQEPVGSLAFSASQVRRRAEGTLVWQEISAGAPLYARDSIFVPPGGQAKVQLGPDAVLELEENSLIVLEQPDAQRPSPSVELVQGGVSGAAGERGLSIRGGTGTVELAEHSEARLAREGDGDQVSVFGGRAKVERGGVALTLGENEATRVERTGALTSSPLGRARLRLPSRNAKIFFQGVARVALQWDSSEPNAFTLELARDRDFSRRVMPPRPGGSEFLFTGTQGGVYWWRLVDAAGKPASEARSFVLLEQTAPVLGSPGDGELVDLSDLGAIPFAWSQVNGAASYRLQLSPTADFARPRIDQVVRGAQLRYPGLIAEGVYYWRVRAELTEGNPPWSAPSTFRLLQRSLLAAPELLDSQVEVRRAPP